MTKKISTAFLFLFLLLFPLQAQSVQPFKKGDRVAFVGNSITDGGHYHSFIWLYYMTRFPQARVDLYNCGIGGDCAKDILERLDQDVFNHKPNVLTLTFGMNDSGYGEYNGENVDEFIRKRVQESTGFFRTIERSLQAHSDIRKIMIGGSPYDETAQIANKALKRKNGTIQQFIALQKTTAQTNNWEFVDFNQPMLEINQEQQKADPGFTLCGQDRIHPDNDGHMVMAWLFLKSQGFSGKPVALMEIDASRQKVIQSENCKLSKLVVKENRVTFNYLSKALPYPLDTMARGWGAQKSQAMVEKYVPFTSEMNREILQVKGLEGMYRLSIDGQLIGDFSSEELTRGLNLATMRNTPQYQQALSVMMLNEERWEIERRFRQYAWIQFSFFQEKNLLFADNQTAIDTLHANLSKNIFLGGNLDTYSKAMHPSIRKAWQDEMDLLLQTIYSINQPKNRSIELLKK